MRSKAHKVQRLFRYDPLLKRFSFSVYLRSSLDDRCGNGRSQGLGFEVMTERGLIAQGRFALYSEQFSKDPFSFFLALSVTECGFWLALLIPSGREGRSNWIGLCRSTGVFT